jgi:hypothetical protein
MTNEKLLLVLLIMWLGTTAHITLVHVRVNDLKHNETISVYTVEDIYYLEGNHLGTESGRLELDFSTRNQAVNFLEYITSEDANSTIE